MAKRTKNDEQVKDLIVTETQNKVNKSTANNGVNAEKMEKQDLTISQAGDIVSLLFAKRLAESQIFLCYEKSVIDEDEKEYMLNALTVEDFTKSETINTKWVCSKEEKKEAIKTDERDPQNKYYLLRNAVENGKQIVSNLHSHYIYNKVKENLKRRAQLRQVKEMNTEELAMLIKIAQEKGLLK